MSSGKYITLGTVSSFPGFQFASAGSAWSDIQPSVVDEKNYTFVRSLSDEEIAIQNNEGCNIDSVV